jgi:hypothetical protein
MKILSRTSLFAVLLFAGCGKLEKQATLASAESFRKLLGEELRRFNSFTFENPDVGAGQAGNTYTREYSYLLPSDKFSPDQLYTVAKTARTKWGEFDSYSTRGEGGGGNQFQMDYGSHRTHTFIDVLAFPDKKNTHIEVLIRVLE